MKKLSELSLADLLGLYNNYMIADTTNCGSAWKILDEYEFEEVQKEIQKRTNTIEFY